MDTFELIKKIGSGSFGSIYVAKNSTDGKEYAIKLEHSKSKHTQLFSEYKIYKIMQGGKGIPQVYQYGAVGEYNVMVMDLLGHSLEDLFNRCKRRFSLKTTLLLGVHMIRRIEFVHSKSFIHRDLKPDNFVMGRGTASLNLFLIDFGLSKRFKDAKTGFHIPLVKHNNMTGTARYASYSAMKGFEQGRRDDLEAIFYILVYFLKGYLPWQGIKEENRIKKLGLISELKEKTTDTLCAGLPKEFQQMFTYIRGLEFEEIPDYSLLRTLLREIFTREGFKDDGVYDWVFLDSYHHQYPQSSSQSVLASAAPSLAPLGSRVGSAVTPNPAATNSATANGIVIKHTPAQEEETTPVIPSSTPEARPSSPHGISPPVASSQVAPQIANPNSHAFSPRTHPLSVSAQNYRTASPRADQFCQSPKPNLRPSISNEECASREISDCGAIIDGSRGVSPGIDLSKREEAEMWEKVDDNDEDVRKIHYARRSNSVLDNQRSVKMVSPPKEYSGLPLINSQLAFVPPSLPKHVIEEDDLTLPSIGASSPVKSVTRRHSPSLKPTPPPRLKAQQSTLISTAASAAASTPPAASTAAATAAAALSPREHSATAPIASCPSSQSASYINTNTSNLAFTANTNSSAQAKRNPSQGNAVNTGLSETVHVEPSPPAQREGNEREREREEKEKEKCSPRSPDTEGKRKLAISKEKM
eukprot:TRINITY_DN668_c3_g1_i1.p1 TRINITY_DN668_c3_g1~~TRINITY_DN668_c3_g1_i1.p1  ORF type:complete len:698 (+),score=157.38 TRINITY_DN668_c3_g1_i1:24-2117(+)